jgi:hypothetical protein
MPPDRLEAIQKFLSSAARPALMEPGEDPLFLTPHNFSLDVKGSLLTLSCWTETRNLVRRIRLVKSARTGRVDLETERFGGLDGMLSLVDLAHPSNRMAARQGARLKYREVFRRALRRQFVDWKIVELSTEPDLEHSLSPAYARALLKKGTSAWAAIGAGADALDIDGALSFGLIWLDYLRQRERSLVVEGLAIFVPAGREATTCHRLRYLDVHKARYRVFVHHTDGLEDAVDPRDYTNLHTSLTPCLPEHQTIPPDWVHQIEGVDKRTHPDGSTRLSVRGIEFARTAEGGVAFGLDAAKTFIQATEASLREIATLAKGIGDLRHGQARDRSNPIYTRHPEAWFESQVRTFIRRIDATLQEEPVYGQVPQLAGGERGLIDLLAIDDTGRLTVLELKTAPDIHLPLQALDYWMRVDWHLARGDFSRSGYFSKATLIHKAPRLYLVAPALDFHPSNQTVLHYLDPRVEVERIGIGLEWRQELRVMFRHRGEGDRLWRSQSSGS